MNGLLSPAARSVSRVWRPAGAQRVAPRRGMAAHADEPVVTWGEYRSGKATLGEWVDANRHVVAGGFFCFYVGLAVNALRPKKNKKPEAAEEAAAVETK